MKTPKPVPEGPDLLQKITPVSRETTEKLVLYSSLLEKWQKSQNLVSSSALSQLWSRHMADSLQLLEYGLSEGPWLDLGSGAGFPGLVIAIAGEGREGHHVHLIESNKRKCAFLAEVIRKTGAPATIHSLRIENSGDILAGIAKTITARAVAPLDRLCSYVEPMLSAGSVALFLKGRGVQAEIEEAERNFLLNYQVLNSKTDPQGVILRLESVKRTNN
jgi:16S rRNA (guanine527-N7)-methyltransferase